MERFNYTNLAAAESEDARIIAFLEAESWGRKKDEEEEMEEREREMELERMKAENG